VEDLQMNEQEIRAKALELAIQTIALFPEQKRVEQLSMDSDPLKVLIALSLPYQNYLKGQPS
jgi:hypothetical protein